MLFLDIIKITLLCIVLGGLSIPLSFNVNSSPWVVWVGNALGSVISAIVVIYIGDRITDDKFKNRISKIRIGKQVVGAFDEGHSNNKVIKARQIINNYGLKIFSLLCPLFPGVLISTACVYLLGLDKKVFKRWMLSSVIFVSGGYVFGYWWVFVK